MKQKVLPIIIIQLSVFFNFPVISHDLLCFECWMSLELATVPRNDKYFCKRQHRKNDIAELKRHKSERTLLMMKLLQYYNQHHQIMIKI